MAVETVLIWLPVTLAIYMLTHWLWLRSGQSAPLHPVATGSLLLIGLLWLLDVRYAEYFSGSIMLHWLLGPATVALAIPLYEQRERLRQLAGPILLATLVGATVGIISALVCGWAFGLSLLTLKSIAAKSVTTPIAMGITEQLGGLIPLTAVVVIYTGVIGAMFALPLLNAVKVTDPSARGLAIGTAAHGVGTARAFQIDAVTGAFSGLAIGLCGLATALMMPLVAWLLGWL